MSQVSSSLWHVVFDPVHHSLGLVNIIQYWSLIGQYLTWNTCSSDLTLSSSELMISISWGRGSSRNSSCSITSWKLCCVNLSAILNRSLQVWVLNWALIGQYSTWNWAVIGQCYLQAWVSANALIPRQLLGSSCLFRNSQQTSCKQ